MRLAEAGVAGAVAPEQCPSVCTVSEVPARLLQVLGTREGHYHLLLKEMD